MCMSHSAGDSEHLMSFSEGDCTILLAQTGPRRRLCTGILTYFCH